LNRDSILALPTPAPMLIHVTSRFHRTMTVNLVFIMSSKNLTVVITNSSIEIVSAILCWVRQSSRLLRIIVSVRPPESRQFFYTLLPFSRSA